MSSGGASSSTLGPDVWKDLLQWTLKQQEEGAAAAAAGTPQPISQEKKEWLEKVMEGTFMDVAKRMQVLLKELGLLADSTPQASQKEVVASEKEEAEEEEEEEKAEALWDELQEHVENLDYALMFCQVQGLPTLFRFLAQAQAHPHNEKAQNRALPALAILATLTQNNPPVQEEVLNYPVAGEARGGVVTLLASFVLMDQPRSSRFLAKTLQALSCTIRGNAAAEEAFLGKFGRQVLTVALQPEQDERVQAKALFFLQALLGADHATQARGQQLASLLPLVVPGLLHEDLGIRHMAARVVSELANLLGGPAAVLKGVGGKELEAAMQLRQATIAMFHGVDLEEFQDEVRFWEVLGMGGTGQRFLRDGETEEGFASGGKAPTVVEEVAGEEAAAAVNGEEEETPVLLLAQPTYLSGASSAP